MQNKRITYQNIYTTKARKRLHLLNKKNKNKNIDK